MGDLAKESLAVEIHERAKGYFSASEQFAYKFLMEIKKIRDEKLYKELGFGDFESYTLDSFGYTRETITNRIQTAETWGRDYDEALRHFGKTKTRQLGIMPEAERKKVIEKGLQTKDGTKEISEATTREIEVYQRKLREKEVQLEKAERSEQVAIKKLEREQNKEPEVIREQVEPDDYNYLKRSNEQLKNQLSAIEERNYKMANEIKEHETDSEKYRQLNEEMKKMNNQLTDGQKKLKAQKEVYDLVRNANQLITEIAPLTYLIDTENIVDNEYARKPIEKIISNLRDMADRLDTSINQQIYEGEIINE